MTHENLPPYDPEKAFNAGEWFIDFNPAEFDIAECNYDRPDVRSLLAAASERAAQIDSYQRTAEYAMRNRLYLGMEAFRMLDRNPELGPLIRERYLLNREFHSINFEPRQIEIDKRVSAIYKHIMPYYQHILSIDEFTYDEIDKRTQSPIGFEITDRLSALLGKQQ